MTNILSDKEASRREFILSANLWHVVLKISVPLALYNMLNHFFGFFDMMIVSHIGSNVVSTVAYLNQLQFMMSSLGVALAIGGGIIIARYYGGGQFQRAQKTMNVLFTISIIVILLMYIIIIPFARYWLILSNMPIEMIDIGTTYFRIEVLSVGLIFLNNVYMAMEKAKGNTKKLLIFNMMVFVIKLGLTALFVYGLDEGVNMVALASLIAQSSLSIAGMYQMIRKDNALRLKLKLLGFEMSLVKTIVQLAFPIFVQKFAFSFGKVIVNSMSTVYGPLTVGALGISNKLGGNITTPPIGFEDGEAAIISQNLGNNNVKRALKTFKITLMINVTIGVVGLLIMFIFMEEIVYLFARDDVVFGNTIISIFKYERIAAITLTISTSVTGLLYGFGYTKLSLLINFMRLFAFRIPTLYIMMKWTNLGSESVGIAMMVSNIMVGITSVIIGIGVIKRLKNQANREVGGSFVT